MSSAAAASSAKSNTNSGAGGGRLYVCGRVAGKGRGLMFPVKDTDVDSHGHCPFPVPFQLPTGADKDVRFSQVKGEHTFVAALEASPMPGALWCCTTEQSSASGKLTRIIPGNVVSFSVGASFAVAALKDGSLVMVGSHHSIDPSPAGSACEDARPFKVRPPKGVTHVSASELNIAIVCGDEGGGGGGGGGGAVYTIGPSGTGNGHGQSLTTEWKQIKLPFAGSDAATTKSERVGDNDGTTAPATANSQQQQHPQQPRAVSVAQGSIHGAAVTACGKVFCWGDGVSGTLAVGSRLKQSPSGTAIGHSFPAETGGAVFAACTTSQLNPKRVLGQRGEVSPGQEGPRLHVVTADGGLWIAGTTHKGLGANCMYKTLSPDEDLLSFYRVGGPALDFKSKTQCPTGGAEDLARRDAAPKEVIARRLGMASTEEFGAKHNTGYLTEPGLKIVSTQPTHIHSVAVSKDGRCFAWGCGSDGRTGLRAFLRGPGGSKRLMKCYVSSPSVVEGLEDKKVIDAYACRNFTLFVVAD